MVTAISFVLGTCFSYYFPVKIIYLSVLSLLLFYLTLINLKKILWGELLFLCTVFSVAALNYQSAVTVPENNISGFITGKVQDVWLKGRVSSGIEIVNIPGRPRKSTFTFKVLAVEENGTWRFVSGKLRASLLIDRADFEFGDTLILKGKISQAKDKISRDSFSYKKYLENQGIYGLLRLNPDSFVVINPSKNILKYIFRLKEKFRKIINETLPYPQRAILTALIIGERTGIPKEINNAFVRTGTVHILAISGLHVGLISYIFYLFLRILRIPRRISYLALAFMLLGYALLTGGNSPVVRSTIMAITYIVGLLSLRRHQILNSLALSCLLILIFKPQQLFNAGFQLSFLSILSIIALVPLIERMFKYGTISLSGKNVSCLALKKIVRYIRCLLIVSLVAWGGIVPVVGYYFKIITPVAVIANLFAIPLSFLVLMVGFMTLLAGLISAAAMQILANTNLLGISLLIKGSVLLSKIPLGSFSIDIFSFPVIFTYYFVLAAIFFMLSTKLPREEKI